MKRLIIFVFLMAAVLSGCQPNPFKSQQGTPAIHDINATLQNDVYTNQQIARNSQQGISADLSNSLMPTLSLDQSALQKEDEQRFNISVSEVPANNFFMSLVKGTQYNMIVDPTVTGTISLDLKNVTIDDVLNAVHDIYGYQYQRTSYAYQVFPRSLETKVFTINYIDVIRTGESMTSVSSSDLTTSTSSQGSSTQGSTTTSQNGPPSSKVETKTVSDFWKNINETLVAMVGTTDGRQVILNPKSGTVVVKAYPNELRLVGRYLDSIQNTMNRQVIIEAKFLEITLNHQYQSGINWSMFGGVFSQQISTLTNEDGSAVANVATLKIDGMSNVIRLLSTQGNVQVIQSPRISTMNNQKAIFKIGKDEYHITNVSVTNNNTASELTNQNTQDVTLSPFFSGVALDVTPQIDVNGDVILHIHPVISKVEDVSKKFTINSKQQELPLASSDVRESDSLVRAKNGQIVVIGGLMENTTEESTNGTPFLEKIPFLGALFRGQNQEAVKTELVILLKPTVVGVDTWSDQLQQSANSMRHLNKGFHFGGNVEVFGNQAEYEYRQQVQAKYSK